MRLVYAIGALLLTSCATSFHGDAHFPGGAPGCRAECQKQGLAMGAFVFAGEYSTACVCVPKSTPTNGGAGALGLAAVGVMTQMRAAQQHHMANAR